MIDPETTRQAAHVLLDAASVQSDTSIDPDTRDDMWALAFDRFKDIEAIRLTQNDETGAVQLDIRRLATATLLVVNGLLDRLAESSGVDRDEQIARLRARIDEELAEEQPD